MPKRWVMKWWIGSIAAIGILLLSGCDRGAGHSVKPNHPDASPPLGGAAAELHRTLGEPATSESSPLKSDSRLETFSTSPETFQVTGEKVVAAFRRPLLNEGQLQFWLQRWKDTLVVKVPVESSRGIHGVERIQYRAPELKESVIYEVHSQQVTEVIRHAE